MFDHHDPDPHDHDYQGLSCRLGADSSSLERLQSMGFGPDIAKVALHVSGGDDRKALQICMSGEAAALEKGCWVSP